MSNFGDLIQEYYVRKFRENAALRKAKVDGLKTAADAKKFVAEARKRVNAAYDFPAKKCDLNVRITGKIEEKNYTIEKVLFDSRPNFPVSANLFIPKNLKGKKAPGVLMLCGHAISEGKASDTYLSVMLSLCLKGCVVLGVDPIGQGERLQYPDAEEVSGCSEHNLLNRRLLLTGDTFGAWRVYDAVRSIDYLLSRKEVDSKRIGVTGNSGGGTLTTLVGGVDDRITATAPGCYITRWYRNVENELPVDAEQIPPGVACDGGDMADFLIAAAPRPVLIMGQKNDFFDIRGTREVYEEVKKVYTLLGKPENVGLQVGPTNHGYSIHNREAAYAFFGKTFGLKADSKEPELKIPAQKDLNAAPDGLTLHVPGSVSIHTLIENRVNELVSKRKKLSEKQLKTALKKMLSIGDVAVPYYRQLRGRYFEADNVYFARYGVETEPGLVCTLFNTNAQGCDYHIPACDRAELYIPHLNSCTEILERVKKAGVPANRRLFAFDYRGVGESMPEGCDQGNRDFFASYRFDYHYDSLALLRNESMLGARVFDVMSAIKLLRAYGTKELILTASGIGEFPALLAAFLTDEPVKLQLNRRVPTYREAALSFVPKMPQSIALRGILSMTDLDEIQDLVEARTR